MMIPVAWMAAALPVFFVAGLLCLVAAAAFKPIRRERHAPA